MNLEGTCTVHSIHQVINNRSILFSFKKRQKDLIIEAFKECQDARQGQDI